MPSLPDCIVEKMDRAAPLVLSALSQLEQTLVGFNMSLYQGTQKHEYLHDFCLMLAVDDLDAIASQLLDASGRPLTEHRIQMNAEDDRDPVLARFKRKVDRQAPRRFDFPRELVTDHASPLVYRRGKTGYQDWLLIPWDGNARPTPISVTRATVLPRESSAENTQDRRMSLTSTTERLTRSNVLRLK